MNNPDFEAKPAVTTVCVTAEQAGRRLDNFIVTLLADAPKSFIYRIIRSGEVRVNGGRKKPHYRLVSADRVRIPPYRPPDRERPEIGTAWLERVERAIVFEDEHLLVIDKPSGLAVHGGSGLSFGAIDVLRKLRESDDIELAHRLDRETSGCLLVAKNNRDARRLHDQFRAGQVDKTYLALLKGEMPARTECDAPLSTSRHPEGEAKTIVAPTGKPARSRFVLRKQFANCALVEIEIDTGRTHQIRVHAAHLGHPVAGDRRYGDPGFNAMIATAGLSRLFLHAASLGFEHPDSKAVIKIHAALPESLQNVILHLE